MAFFTQECKQKIYNSKIFKPKIYNWYPSSTYDPKTCTITSTQTMSKGEWFKFLQDNTIVNVPKPVPWNCEDDNITTTVVHNTNNNKKEDDNMNQTTKADSTKNRMGVFAKGISFDTPSGTTQYIIPQIKEIKAINNRVVIIKFTDGTQEKAVLDSSDTFSIEQGVAICITKKILSKLTYGNGSSAYNKLIDYAMKIYDKQENNKKKIEEEQIKTEQQANKREEKKKNRVAKMQEKEKEELINILSEAITKSMQSINPDISSNSEKQ